MKKEYEYKELYDELDDVVFSAERLGEKISKGKYLDMTDRELLRNALAICMKLYRDN
jgi:hypothetical protein